MKTFAVDLPAYVTVRLQARDEAHAREIVAEHLADFDFEVAADEQEMLGAPDGPSLMLSPAVSIYGAGIEAKPADQLFFHEEPEAE